jgi:predicted phosphodiesterase
VFAIQWSKHPSLLKRLIELDTRGYSAPEIGLIIYKQYPDLILASPTRDQVKNALVYAKQRLPFLDKKFIPDTMPYYNKYIKQIRGDDVVAKNTALLSDTLSSQRRKILVIADIHVPFTDEGKLQKAVDLHRSADIVVIAGDVMDMYGCSRHRKRMSVPHELEVDRTVRFLEYISETFPMTVVLPGNHDKRPMKKIQDVVPPELFYLFEDNDTLSLLTRPFSNIMFHNDWFYQIGDAVFTHAERSSSIEGRPAVLTADFFLVKGWAKRLKMDPIRVVVQAHTHQVSSVYREDLKMMECGCLAQVMEYTTDSSAVMRPPMNGCVSLMQYNGLTDFNESREWVL